MMTLLFVLAPLACAPSATPSGSSTPPTPSATTAEPVTALALTGLRGEPIPPETLEGKAVVFVNVASECGYTPQYEGLQALYEARKSDGLVIVGVPSNQFGGQEPGTPEQIQQFCKLNYGVTFPLLEKQDVKGKDQSPLYANLVGSEVGGGVDVAWNFEKFVVARNGQVIARFPSRVAPSDPQLAAAIEQALGG